MILGTHEGILDADTFIASLQDFRESIFRVFNPDNRAACTGWLLTDQLIVVPAFGITPPPPPDGYVCYRHTAQGETTHKADLCYLPADASSITATATTQPPLRYQTQTGLLRLRQPMPNAVLSLQSRSIELGAKVLLLHFPKGQPRLAFSMGQITVVDEALLRYDADTIAGSSGAPILINGEVVGYHHSPNKDIRANEGISLSGIFQGLRASSAWPEIVTYHRLADVSATEASAPETDTPPPNRALLRAAVQWAFDPATFSEAERDELEPMVMDMSSEHWILTPDERQRLLRQAGSIDALRQARGLQPTDDPRQAVIDRLLQGPHFDLSNVVESDLPYWLQAVRWFEGVIPQLPSSGEVSQTLERLRIRSQFEPIAGATFRGRFSELQRFGQWFRQAKPGPLVVSGIGGMGKSSLVARFARSLPNDTLLLWLDFDRADIAPDDAPSVLSLIWQQASLQLTSIDGPDLTELVKKSAQPLPEAEKAPFEEQIQQATVAIGKALARQLTDARPPLLVLDGFEVAQHRQRYTEIWPVLESLLQEVPSLRIIVSGRAPVRDLTLGGRKAEPMRLTGITDGDADAWLLDQGIADADVRAQVVRVARGIPLNLRLAVRLAKAGGDLHKLPQDLEENMVSGYLYDRILDRVIDASLKPVVEAVLVLRKVTPMLLHDLLTNALSGNTTTDPTSAGAAVAEDTFNRLARELAVVDANAVFSGVSAGTSAERTLWIRPDLRSATLRLLERNNADRVRDLDQRAANWYATHDLTDEATAAELIYHWLRLGDINGAKTVWNDRYVPYLRDAEDDLWPDARRERAWLRKQLKRANTPLNALLEWEKGALSRVQNAQSRGLDRIMGGILSEQAERSEQSPLRFYDAWYSYRQGDLTGARALLKKAIEIDGPSGRDQAVLAAQLAVLANDLPAAAQLLAAVDNPARWTDRPQGNLEALAVRAARIRLTVDLEKEFKLADLLADDNNAYLSYVVSICLSAYDVMLPSLQQKLNRDVYESASAPVGLTIPYLEQSLLEFQTELLNSRGVNGALDNEILPEPVAKTVRQLAELSRQRISRITDDLFILEAIKVAMYPEPLQLSIAGTLAALHGWNFNFVPNERFVVTTIAPETTLNAFIGLTWNQYTQRTTSLATQQGVTWAERFLQRERYGEELMQWIRTLKQQTGKDNLSELRMYLTSDQLKLNTVLKSLKSPLPLVLLYMLSPDPLETLCRRLLSLPETFQF